MTLLYLSISFHCFFTLWQNFNFLFKRLSHLQLIVKKPWQLSNFDSLRIPGSTSRGISNKGPSTEINFSSTESSWRHIFLKVYQTIRGGTQTFIAQRNKVLKKFIHIQFYLNQISLEYSHGPIKRVCRINVMAYHFLCVTCSINVVALKIENLSDGK